MDAYSASKLIFEAPRGSRSEQRLAGLCSMRGQGLTIFGAASEGTYIVSDAVVWHDGTVVLNLVSKGVNHEA